MRTLVSRARELTHRRIVAGSTMVIVRHMKSPMRLVTCKLWILGKHAMRQLELPEAMKLEFYTYQEFTELRERHGWSAEKRKATSRSGTTLRHPSAG